MDALKMKKSDLLEVLRKNKEKHVEEYELALHAYRIACAEAMEQAWLQCVDGGEILTNPCYKFSKPQSHERDYTMVIGMLEMTIEDEIEVDTNEYTQYVLDEWSWRSSFNQQTSGVSGYSGAAGSSGSSGYSGSSGFVSVKRGK